MSGVLQHTVRRVNCLLLAIICVSCIGYRDLFPVKLPPTPSAQNFAQHSELLTSVLLGKADASIDKVEIALDGGSFQPANGTTSWRHQLPTGAATWKTGTVHTIAVRGVDARGVSSLVAEYRVRKGRNQDLNGDGYADVIIGTGNYSSGRGRVYIFYGRETGLTGGGAATADHIITGEIATAGYFGNDLATGDVNGDGYADLAVGAFDLGSGGGRAYIFHGSASGVIQTDATAANTILTTDGLSNYLGSGPSFGDLNGDGYEDFAVAGARSNTANNRLYIYYGGISGISSGAANTVANRTITPEAGLTAFGRSCMGDINGDGYADLVVSAFRYNSFHGRVYIFPGSASGITNTTAASAPSIITGEATANAFGITYTVADTNGDGYADVAIGASQYNSNAGRVYVFLGSASGLFTGSAAALANTIMTGENTGNDFGAANKLILADLNRDSYPELVVGAYSYNSTQGRAYIFSGSTSGFASSNASSATTIVTGSATGDRFSISTGYTDFNGDTHLDLLIAADQVNSNQGVVYLLTNTGGGFSSGNINSLVTIQITGEAANNYLGAFP